MEYEKYKFTEYFEKEVLRKRSYTKTIHNAFPDRRFKNEN